MQSSIVGANQFCGVRELGQFTVETFIIFAALLGCLPVSSCSDQNGFGYHGSHGVLLPLR